MAFELVAENEDFVDYELDLPDNPTFGGKVRISVCKSSGDAYGIITFDNEDGDVILHQEFEVTKEQASKLLALPQGTP